MLVLCQGCFFSSDAPFNVKIEADSGVFVKGQSLTLNCRAEANPKPSEYKWHKDGQIVTGETEAGPQSLAGSQLLFSSLDYEKNGTYNCTAINSVGEAQSSSFVIVVDGTFSLN